MLPARTVSSDALRAYSALPIAPSPAPPACSATAAAPSTDDAAFTMRYHAPVPVWHRIGIAIYVGWSG